MSTTKQIEQAYRLAKERYAALGVDTDKALKQLAGIPISIHCWQGDDVGGFENAGQELGGGLAVTGNYPGKARTPDELRADFEQALSVIPGRHRFNLHACYAEMSGRKVDRDELSAEQFKNWIAWAKVHQDRPRLQPDLLRPSQGRRRLHAHQRGQGHPPVLDRARHPLPRDRRRHRQGPRQHLPHQPLDSRRHEGHSRRPPRPARAPGRVARRRLQEED